jgi:hypothetical protein
MRQSRSTSLLKSIISTAVGFGISLAAQWAILPVLIGHPVPLEANLAFAAIMTVLSIARGYVLERVFEMLGWRMKISPFAFAALAERQRQMDAEGWSTDHDDHAHAGGELRQAAACYIMHAGTTSETEPHGWPWLGWWKPKGFRKDMVRGVALAIAEGERFDRDRKRGRGR